MPILGITDNITGEFTGILRMAGVNEFTTKPLTKHKLKEYFDVIQISSCSSLQRSAATSQGSIIPANDLTSKVPDTIIETNNSTDLDDSESFYNSKKRRTGSEINSMKRSALKQPPKGQTIPKASSLSHTTTGSHQSVQPPPSLSKSTSVNFDRVIVMSPVLATQQHFSSALKSIGVTAYECSNSGAANLKLSDENVIFVDIDTPEGVV
jgi:hypothetical protein